jgi:hypothetical protein
LKFHFIEFGVQKFSDFFAVGALLVASAQFCGSGRKYIAAKAVLATERQHD